MEEFISVDEMMRLFMEFCSKEISACGSNGDDYKDCGFYKKWVEFVKENK